MTHVVQARVDESTLEILEELKRRHGWTDSETIRAGIRSLGKLIVKEKPRRIAGLGEFDSGVTDLGSNKRHLENFGK